MAATPETTRSTHPFLLVKDGLVVGYAAADTNLVRRRARRLGAELVPNPRRHGV